MSLTYAAYIGIYALLWWLTSVLALRRIAANGQRNLDNRPSTGRVLRCGGDCGQARVNRRYGFSDYGSHHSSCYRMEPTPPEAYTRTDSDVLTAIAWGFPWIATWFLWSVSKAPKTRAEKNAELRVRNASLEKELAAAQARYEALEKA